MHLNDRRVALDSIDWKNGRWQNRCHPLKWTVSVTMCKIVVNRCNCAALVIDAPNDERTVR